MDWYEPIIIVLVFLVRGSTTWGGTGYTPNSSWGAVTEKSCNFHHGVMCYAVVLQNLRQTVSIRTDGWSNIPWNKSTNTNLQLHYVINYQLQIIKSISTIIRYWWHRIIFEKRLHNNLTGNLYRIIWLLKQKYSRNRHENKTHLHNNWDLTYKIYIIYKEPPIYIFALPINTIKIFTRLSSICSHLFLIGCRRA